MSKTWPGKTLHNISASKIYTNFCRRESQKKNCEISVQKIYKLNLLSMVFLAIIIWKCIEL